MTDDEREALYDMLTSLAWAIIGGYDGERDDMNYCLRQFEETRNRFFSPAKDSLSAALARPENAG